MAFDSFRDFVNALDRAGELKRISQPVATEPTASYRPRASIDCLEKYAVKPAANGREAAFRAASFPGLENASALVKTA